MPPQDKDKDKDKPKPTAARKPSPRRPRVPPVEPNGQPQPNGHETWPDYGARTTSWDPWDEGDGAPADSANRTLGEWLEAVVPPEAQVHFFNAAQELVAGIQTTIEYHRNPDQHGDDGGAGALRIEIE